MSQPIPPSDPARTALLALRAEIGKAVVGQDAVVSGLVIALLCRGHVLLEGVPGVAKTLLVRALAAALQLDFKRVQFTPDLMPGDVTGSLVYDARTAAFEFRAGPVFTNLLLADEINRTPPKTQSALLEVMEEENLIEIAKQRGQYLLNRLKAIDSIENVRGRGMMIGFDVPEAIKDLRKKLLHEHFIFTGEAKPNVIRLLPALNISKKQVDEFIDTLKDAIAELQEQSETRSKVLEN